MNRTVAVKKLAAHIGKGFGYRIDDKAPTPEQREAARAELPDANKKRDELRNQWEARRDALLKADPEYQRLYADWKAANTHVVNLSGLLHRHKFTVGKSVGLAGFPMFSVSAEGDSWEEVFAKLKLKAA